MPRAGLDREAIVEAAARIADADGPRAVTIARVAAALHVRPPSLYAHVSGLEEIRNGLAIRGARQLTAVLQQAATGRAGADALHALARAYRAYATAHRGSYAALQQVPDPHDPVAVQAASELVAVVLAVLRGYRLEGDEAIHAARLIRSALHGFVALEADGGFGLPLDLDESFARLIGVLDRGLRSGLT